MKLWTEHQSLSWSPEVEPYVAEPDGLDSLVDFKLNATEGHQTHKKKESLGYKLSLHLRSNRAMGVKEVSTQ